MSATRRPPWPSGPTTPTFSNAACTYGVLIRKAEALATLKKAISAGWANPNWAARDADLDCLHDDPEFRKLVGLSDAAAS